MKVWSVWTGHYSDRQMHGIFSSRKNAEDFAALIDHWSNEDPDIYEEEVDAGISLISRGFKPFRICMFEDGKLFDDYNMGQEDITHFKVSTDLYKYADSEVFLVCLTWARDLDHAVKIANEKRSRMIATGEWETRAKEITDELNERIERQQKHMQEMIDENTVHGND